MIKRYELKEKGPRRCPACGRFLSQPKAQADEIRKYERNMSALMGLALRGATKREIEEFAMVLQGLPV